VTLFTSDSFSVLVAKAHLRTVSRPAVIEKSDQFPVPEVEAPQTHVALGLLFFAMGAELQSVKSV
jgi:hypothetical protein